MREGRHTGIASVGDVSGGTHFCLFYQEKQDLIDILVPYFKEGLKQNELCLWVTSEPLPPADARAELAAEVPHLDTCIADGQLEILDTEWYSRGGGFEAGRIIQGWIDRLETPGRQGFTGVRLAGNLAWLERPQWHSLMEYESAVDALIKDRRLLAICTYALPKCDALQIMDVISNHAFALAKRADKWETIGHDDAVIQRNRLSAVLEALPTGVALIDARGGKVESNAAFERVWGEPGPSTGIEAYASRKAWWTDTGQPVQPHEWASALAVHKGETVLNQEMEIERFDGSHAFVLNSAAPIRDAQGRISGSVVSIRDITKLKHAEAALRESDSRFRALVTATADVVYRMSPDWKTMLYLRGRDFIADTEEASATWLRKYIPSEDQAYVTAVIDEAIRTRSTFELEHRVRRVDGSLGWTFSRAIPVLNGDGEIVEWFGAASDITERKRIEEELRRNQAQLMNSQRLANVGSWERDFATGSVRWSDQMYRIYGIPGGTQPVFQTFLSLLHPKDRDHILSAQGRALATGVPVVVEYRIVRPDGEVRFIRSIAEPVKNEQGVPFRFTGTDQDITEQVKSTELLRESEARLKTAEHLTRVGNWIWDIKAKRVSWSEEMFRITGLPRTSEPSWQASLQMLVPGDKARMEQWVRDCLADRKGKLIEVRIVLATGEVRTVVCTSELLLDEDGVPDRMFGTCQDVTDARREQEESFARQKLESLGTLAGGIAHDFNNLLGAILARTELAMSELVPGSPTTKELEEIRKVAIRGSEIVRQLMIYTVRESDVLELTDVSKAIEEILGLLKVTVPRHATLVTHLGQPLPGVKARAAQLQQIVMNLVVNAAEAIKDHEGVVRVTTRSVTIGRDSAGAMSDGLVEGEYVELEVSDSGSGMSPETQSRVFDPFFTTKSAGRGLGLAVVLGLVRSLNGTVRIISELNRGTTFQVLLPCAGVPDREAVDALEVMEEITDTPQPATVLVVEDEPSIRMAVSRMLSKAGFSIHAVDNGSDAIELLRDKAGTIDVILLDLTIPGAPSHEVLAAAASAEPNIKVILTSAYNEDMAGAVLHAAQIRGFIRKPFQFNYLLRTLRDVVSSKMSA